MPEQPPSARRSGRSASSETDRTLIVVVLAAGLGTRMRSATPKVLHPLCGRPMLAYVLDVARAVAGAPPIVVVSPATSAVREAFEGAATFALQDEPRGTADAVHAALASLPDTAGELVVLSGDVPLLDPTLVTDLVAARRETDAALALVSVVVDEPGSLGRVVRDERGRVSGIVEARDATPAELAGDEVNAGIYAFDLAWLRSWIDAVAPSAATGELYLTELVRLARGDDRAVACLEVEDDGSLLGINDRLELADAQVELRLRINERHMRAGVTIVDPASAWIDAGVTIAEDVVVEPGVILSGATEVARDARIRTGSQVVDSTIGERTVVWASVIEASVIGHDVTVGPFAHVRAGSTIETGVQLGNYAEVKNSRLGAGTKSHHFSYLGDADVGAGVNIGAGTITANFDGQRKHRTRIGDAAFIGSDTTLRAPVEVGAGAYTGAGSVVTRDVPPGMLAVGVPARIRPRTSADPQPPTEPAPTGSAVEGELGD
jgi:bifunctional UDP-N-acetylglucosamine pyrophosphorylase/glucosamine-1-phosphate N-acetyltransferase